AGAGREGGGVGGGRARRGGRRVGAGRAGRAGRRVRAGRSRRTGGAPRRHLVGGRGGARRVPAAGERAADRPRGSRGNGRRTRPGADAVVTVHIMIAEDQTMVRQALVALLELEGDITVVAQAARGDEAIAMAHRYPPG